VKGELKRETLHVYDQGQFAYAWLLTKHLKSRGIDVKLVSKHAVQVHPAQAEEAKKVLSEFNWEGV
jgi:hypothetical protein